MYPVATIDVQRAQHTLQGSSICETENPIKYTLIDTDNTNGQLTLL
jgi:hypothetical protein